MGGEKRKREEDEKGNKGIPLMTAFCPGDHGTLGEIKKTFSMPEALAKATLEVSKSLVGPDDHGFAIMFSDPDSVHAAMGRNNAPAGGQGANAAASLTALRNWIVQQIPDAATQEVDMSANALSQGICIKNMTITEATQFRIAINEMVWAADCLVNGHSAGSLMAIHGEGDGRCTIIRVPHSGFI